MDPCNRDQQAAAAAAAHQQQLTATSTPPAGVQCAHQPVLHMAHRHRPLRFAVLNPDDQEKWDALMPAIWRIALGVLPDDTLDIYNWPRGQTLDPEDAVSKYDVVVVSGSRYSVYEQHAWIRQLEETVRRYVALGVRVVGCCFGHQLLAQALGGEVGKNPSGRFVLGVEDIQLDEAAMRACGLGLPPPPPVQSSQADEQSAEGTEAVVCVDQAQAASGAGAGVQASQLRCRLQLLQSHGDQVLRLPPGATPLATSGTARYEMWCLGGNVLSFQFHPEVTAQMCLDLICPALSASGRLDDAESGEAQRQLLHKRVDSTAFHALLRRFLEDGLVPGKAAAAAAADPPQPAAVAAVDAAAAGVLAHTRGALAAGLAEGTSGIALVESLNRVAAAQYGQAAAEASAVAGKLGARAAGQAVPLQAVLGTLGDLEQQLDRLHQVVDQLDLEAKDLEQVVQKA